MLRQMMRTGRALRKMPIKKRLLVTLLLVAVSYGIGMFSTYVHGAEAEPEPTPVVYQEASPGISPGGVVVLLLAALVPIPFIVMFLKTENHRHLRKGYNSKKKKQKTRPD